MAKVALIGASGRVGSAILKELVSRGHRVTAVARKPDAIRDEQGVTKRRGDIFEPGELANILQDHDAVISSVKFVGSEPSQLVDAVRKSGVSRYLVVGGAGSLEVAPGQKLSETLSFPDAFKAEAARGGEFLDYLRTVTDLDWTFLSPSALFSQGERTGKFRLGMDELLTTDGKSAISFEDYSVALVDELEKPRHVKQRFTVGY
ncbi:NAD(P)-dependent oxidoreductase [Agrobacterium sp. MCAB5]|uniref:NAD(P)-dependent oxidoreductase n=1 Tax=Agrobacterium sp. MCAB5 TaxID=3233042 RepID=UPI003F93ADFB